jgi:hypothetical protein
MMNAGHPPAGSLIEIMINSVNNSNNETNMNKMIAYVCYYGQQFLGFLQGSGTMCQKREYFAETSGISLSFSFQT